jgi:hypothetical protein
VYRMTLAMKFTRKQYKENNEMKKMKDIKEK